MNDLLVHPHFSQALEQTIASPPHALLLTGPQGVGKTHLARQMSAQLLQVDPDKLVNAAYYREVTPIKRVITIEQIRGLNSFFRLKVPGKARVKRVAVIHDADTMGTEAQNALLKLLEEPPEGSVLVLTSSNSLGLLPTIRSRTQTIIIPPPTPEVIKEHFIKRGHSAAKVERAALRHMNNIAAISAELEEAAEDDSTLDIVKQALSGTSFERLLLIDSLAKQKDSAKDFVDTLSAVAAASLETAALKQTANFGRWKQVLQASRTAGEALEQNGNVKLVLTELMLGL